MEARVMAGGCAAAVCDGKAAAVGLAGALARPFFGGASSWRCCSSRLCVDNRRRLGLVSVQGKGKRSFTPGRQPSSQPMPAFPKDNDDNPQVPRWYPLSVVTGGTTAKMMLAAMSNDWGKKLYGGTLTRNIAEVVYKDERALRQTAFKQYPVLKSASGFEYGFKVMDKNNPKGSLFATDVTKIPPQGEMKSVVDRVKDFFGNTVGGIKESFGSISNLSGSSQEQGEQPSDSKKPK